jgi:glycerol uptake facilitator-like aquaporin
MKQPPSEPSILTRQPALKIFVFEFTGTLLLTYGVVCSDIDSAPTDFFIACSLFLAISWCGEFTRAHVNPAVSLGIWISQRYPLIISYVLAQILGGFIGSMLGTKPNKLSLCGYRNKHLTNEGNKFF